MPCAINAILSDRACAINHLRGVMEGDGACTPCATCETGRRNREQYPELRLTFDTFNHYPILVGNPIPRSKDKVRATKPPDRGKRAQPAPPPRSLAELRAGVREDW